MTPAEVEDRVKSVLNELQWLRKRRPDAKYILLDDQDYIISSIHTRGVMVAMTLLGNDGTELIKMVSPENMSIKIEEVKK